MTDNQITDFVTHRVADKGNVNIEIIDVLSGQRAMFTEELPEAIREVGITQVAEPLRPWWQPMKENAWIPIKPESDDPIGYAMLLNIAPLDMDRARAIAGLDRFGNAGSLEACADAIVQAFDRLEPAAHGISLPTIRYTLALANPSIVQERDQFAGYVGFGGIPGQIMMIALPNDYNMTRLAAMAAHEAHHNVRLTHEPWDPATITVGQYIVLEGLAEAFSVEMFGEESLGPWTLMHSEDLLRQYRPRFREVLDTVGDPRGYMFGDWAAAEFHYEPTGLPDYIGYGMGYRIVKSFLEATGRTATEASYLPWREIVAGAGWLHDTEAG